MIKKSGALYLSGYVTGALICLLVSQVYPPLYYFFIELLVKKMEAQSSVIEDPRLMIGSNNLFAATMLAYGGYLTTRLYIWLDASDSSSWLRRLEKLDGSLKGVRDEDLKYYLALFAIPMFILFMNGFVLGSFLVLYIGSLDLYITRLLPHGYFELPATILAGSIGLSIAYRGRETLLDMKDFKETIRREASSKKVRFLAVLVMILIGANLEGGGMLAG